MLVLSRRQNERIVFPDAGITLEIVRLQGSVVRLGIVAPRQCAVFREELLEREGAPGGIQRASDVASHDQRNVLSRITLALHLFNKQRAAGLHAEADETLERVFKLLGSAPDTGKGDPKEGKGVPERGKRGPAKAISALIVDDDENERELLAGVLRMNGVQCHTASDGERALNYLSSHKPPDFVLLDMWMPRCNGIQTLRKLRSHPQYARLKVFSISGSSPDSLGVGTGPVGVDAWFLKPLNPSLLWEAMRGCATKSQDN